MKYILITGGQLLNKGAQAMVFITITEIKKKYPDAEIVLLSKVDYFNNENKETYNFHIYPLLMRSKFMLAGGFWGLLNRLIKYKNYQKKLGCYEKKLKHYFSNATMIIDISGYAFSSQWGFIDSLNFLFNIKLAKKYNIDMFILPQSLGPLNYPKCYQKKIIKTLTKKYFKYPRKIFAREQSGFLEMKKLTDNIDLSYDIVLQGNKELNFDAIYKNEVPRLEQVSIEKNSVALIPNQKLFNYGQENELYQIYNEIIQYLLANRKKIYLLIHSVEDKIICQRIKKKFTKEEDVIIFEEEFECFELEEMLNQFDYIIASRYHSIVHAYRESTPAIVISWAEKYYELLKHFDQEEYLFDIRNTINSQDIISSIKKLNKTFKKDAGKINKKLTIIRENNIFDQIF